MLIKSEGSQEHHNSEVVYDVGQVAEDRVHFINNMTDSEPE